MPIAPNLLHNYIALFIGLENQGNQLFLYGKYKYVAILGISHPTTQQKPIIKLINNVYFAFCR